MRSKEEILRSHPFLKTWVENPMDENPIEVCDVEQALWALDKYRLEILEDVKLHFEIYSDFSTFCLGYKNLVDRIRREKENEPIDRSISPIKRTFFNDDKIRSWDDGGCSMGSSLNTDD